MREGEIRSGRVSRPIIHPAYWTPRLDRIQKGRKETNSHPMLSNEYAKGARCVRRVDK